MKRALTIFILLAYFTVSSGFVVNLHYCMDRFHSWDIGGSAGEKCDTCGMKLKKSKCCHDQVKLVKVQQDATQAKYFASVFAAPALPAPLYSDYFYTTDFPAERPAAPAHGPPLISKQDTYLRNCVFLI